MARRARRDSAMTPNSRGQFTKRVGKLSDGKAPVFSLGSDEREARIRLGRIRDLWDLEVVRRGGDYWGTLSLRLARSLAAGEAYVISSRTSEPSPMDLEADDYAVEVESIKKLIPEAVPEDSELFKRGQAINSAKFRDMIKAMIREELEVAKEIGILPQDYSEESIDGTLHDVLSAYSDHLKTKPAKDAWRRNQLELVDRLKSAHDDLPLAKLDHPTVQGLIDYWRYRPRRSNGQLFAKSSCRHQIASLVACLRWASLSHQFEWTMPGDSQDFEKSIETTKSELREKLDRVAVETYTVDELRKFFSVATDLDRCLLLLGLNCAFGAAESGRLVPADCFLRKAHPRAEWIDFDFQEGQSFISFIRPKSEVLGDWLLWDSTVEYLEKMILRSRKLKSEVIICRDKTGNPLYSTTSKNGQSGFANRWKKLVHRVQTSDSTFRYLPFGSLRDKASDTIRQRYDAELASMVLAHGSPVKDKLLESYNNQPVGKLFSALQELEGHYSPIWS